MNLLNVNRGTYMNKLCQTVNMRRKRSSIYRMTDRQKKRRKILRHAKKKKENQNIDKEGPSYEPEGF